MTFKIQRRKTMKMPTATTGTGIAMILGAIADFLRLMFDGDPTTNASVQVTLGIIFGGIAAIRARENNQDSEAAGIK